MVRSLVVVAALPIVAFTACQGSSDPSAADAPRRVVVRGADPAQPPSATDGIEIGPSDGAPEIVILPDPEPRTRTRVVRETVPADPPIAPAPEARTRTSPGPARRFRPRATRARRAR